MKNLSISLFVSVIAVRALAQQPPVSPASAAYEAYRMEDTKPNFGLRKVESLVRKIKSDKDDNPRMADRVYEGLNFAEKFTFAMIHGEEASQNCDDMPPIVGEERLIFCYIPGPFNEQETWSARQLKFLHENRTKVIGKLRSTIRLRHRVGVNLKQAITELRANELIPDVLAVYKSNRRDHDILTVCMQLMKDGAYEPFLGSSTYKKLYGNKMNYQAHIDANATNRRIIVAQAMAFYRSRTR